MRLFYLSASSIPSTLANSVHVMKMCGAFARQGHEVILFARKGTDATADPFTFYGCERIFSIEFCSRLDAGLIGKLSHPFAVAGRIAKMPRPQVLYSRHTPSLVATAFSGAYTVYEAHTLPSSPLEAKVQSWLFRRTNFGHLVVISDVLRRDYIARFPSLARKRVIVAHDGADARNPVTSKIDRSCKRTQVGYVGSLYPGKGMEMIVALAERMPDIDFHVVGGSERDLRYWKPRTSAKNLRFHGHVPHGALDPFYSGFDIVLAPLQRRITFADRRGDIGRWTSPLKIFEYMAQRKAIVCSDLPVLREILTHGRNAVLANPESAEEWIEAIRGLQADPRLRDRLGASAEADLRAHYLWDQRAERVLAGLG